jgi:LacI family transcriptional regulator
VSIKDVAARAGVSVGTVSNVLNRPDTVSSATATRVRDAIRDLGFVRNESARQLRAGKSRVVGLLVLDVGNPFFTELARGAEEVLTEAGLAVMLCSSDDDPEKEARYLGLLEEQRVQGLLVSPIDAVDKRLAEIRRRGTPVVMVDRTATSRNQCSAAVDDVQGGRLAAEHLLGQGHRKLAFVGGPAALQQVADRSRGAHEAVGSVRGAALTVLEPAAMTVAAGRAAAADLLALKKRPTAVFCANDLLAIGLQQALLTEGVSIPGDVAVVGYDDVELAAAVSIPLTSVRQPTRRLGRAAAKLLLEESSGEAHRHRHLVFAPELVVRESSAAG